MQSAKAPTTGAPGSTAAKLAARQRSAAGSLYVAAFAGIGAALLAILASTSFGDTPPFMGQLALVLFYLCIGSLAWLPFATLRMREPSVQLSRRQELTAASILFAAGGLATLGGGSGALALLLCPAAAVPFAYLAESERRSTRRLAVAGALTMAATWGLRLSPLAGSFALWSLLFLLACRFLPQRWAPPKHMAIALCALCAIATILAAQSAAGQLG